MDRRQFLTTTGLAGAGLLWPDSLLSIGDASKITIAELQHGGGSMGTRSSALRRLLQEVEKRTSIAVDTAPPAVSAQDEAFFEHPFAAMFGDQSFDPLPDAVIGRIRTYLQSGGFLYVDSSEGVRDGPFMESIRRMFGRLFPDRQLAALSGDHVLYKSFYLIDDSVGRIDVSDELLGISDTDRLLAVVNQNDLLGALARDNFGNWEYEVRPGGEQQREMAFRLGINLVMYALCINYKSDQVHVPFILKRRKWKVD